jgi:hypothetical protein
MERQKMRITKRQLRRIIKEEKRKLLLEGLELKKGLYGYEGADQPTYDNAYDQVMDIVSTLAPTVTIDDVPTDPKVQAAIYNALSDIAKELELEIKMAPEHTRQAWTEGDPQ